MSVEDRRTGRRPENRQRNEKRRSSIRYQERSDRRTPQRRPASKEKSKTGKILLFAIEMVVLVALVGILWTVLKTEKVGKVNLDVEDIVINEEVKAKMQAVSSGEDSGSGGMFNGFRNVALFGVDSREGALTKNTRSDTIIVASINEETGECRLMSVYRDTYLNLGNDTYNKCNAAYAKGGPMQAINMLNMNLDLDITDFVTIGFDGLIDVIDAVGGVEVEVLDSEIVHLNNYQISMVGKSKDGETFTADAGKDYIPVTNAGVQVLNGLQATAYCRIRYVGNDFQRTERQRKVIMGIVEKAKQNPSKLPEVAEKLFGEVYTSFDLTDIISILKNIGKYQITEQAGFPDKEHLGGANVGKKGSCVIPLTLEGSVKWLHKFLFGTEDYDPSNAVKQYSKQIIMDAAPYM